MGEMRLPKTGSNIPMPNVRTCHDSHWCDTCCKSDVCMYREDTMHLIAKIEAMTKAEGVFLNVEPSCQKWVKSVPVSRGISGGNDNELCISR